MGTIKLSPTQAELIGPWADPWIKFYFVSRYGQGWLYYWMEWENNREIML